MKEDPKLTKTYEIISNMSNQARAMRKAIEVFLTIMPREHLINAMAELHDRRLREVIK